MKKAVFLLLALLLGFSYFSARPFFASSPEAVYCVTKRDVPLLTDCPRWCAADMNVICVPPERLKEARRVPGSTLVREYALSALPFAADPSRYDAHARRCGWPYLIS